MTHDERIAALARRARIASSNESLVAVPAGDLVWLTEQLAAMRTFFLLPGESPQSSRERFYGYEKDAQRADREVQMLRHALHAARDGKAMAFAAVPATLVGLDAIVMRDLIDIHPDLKQGSLWRIRSSILHNDSGRMSFLIGPRADSSAPAHTVPAGSVCVPMEEFPRV